MWTRHLMAIAWPAFLVAAVLEMVVFALVDPQDLHWAGASLTLSREAVYTLAFFAFWLAAMASSTLSLLLVRSPADINREASHEAVASDRFVN